MNYADNIELDCDLPSRTVRVFHWDETGQQGIIEDRQDVEPIANAVKALGVEHSHNRRAHYRPVASIPMNIYHELRQKWKALGMSQEEQQTALKNWLNDRDNSLWKYDPSFKV